MSSERACSRCGSAIPADASGQFCQGCSIGTDQSTRSAQVPLPVESPQRESPNEGLRIEGYRILRVVGRGGMGVVYEAIEEDLNRRVALKLLPGNVSVSGRELERFRREASVASRLAHPGIVRVYRIDESHGNHFFVMEYIDGESLQQFLEKQRTQLRQADSLSEVVDRSYVERVVRWFISVGSALHAAHESGVIHRDVKPGNILLATDGRIVVTDFGLAREHSAETLTVAGEFMGTPAYMSPEQVLASRVAIDHRSDVYSLGVTLYESLTLETPFAGESMAEVLQQISFKDAQNPRNLNPRIPLDLGNVVLKALEKDPDRRYGSMGDFVRDLEAFLASEPVCAQPIGVGRRLRRTARRYPRLVAVTAGVLSLLIAGIIGAETYLRNGRFVAIDESSDGTAAVRVYKGRPGWRVLGYPRLVADTGFLREDVRGRDRRRFTEGVPLGQEQVALNSGLISEANVRALDLVGNESGVLQAVRSALETEDREECQGIFRMCERLGTADLIAETQAADLEWLYKGRPSELWEADWLLRELFLWWSHSDIDVLRSWVEARLAGGDQEQAVAVAALAMAPTMYEVAPALETLLTREGDLPRLGYRDAATPRDLLRHLDEERRNRVIRSWLQGSGRPARLRSSLGWLDPEQSRAALPLLKDAASKKDLKQWQIEQLHPSLVREILTGTVRDDRLDADIRARRLSFLLGFVDQDAVIEFEGWLEDEEPVVRLQAARNILVFGPRQDAVEIIRTFLEDGSHKTNERLWTATSMLSGGPADVDRAIAFLNEHIEEHDLGGSNSRRLGDAALGSSAVHAALRSALSDASVKMASLLHTSLAWVGEEADPDALLDSVLLGYGWSREAARVLGIVADRAMERRVVELLQSSREQTQAELQRVLIEIFKHRPVGEVIPYLGHRSPKIRQCAIVDLSSRPDDDHAADLKAMGEPPQELSASALAAREVLLRLQLRRKKHALGHEVIREAILHESKGNILRARADAEWARKLMRESHAIMIMVARKGTTLSTSIPLTVDECPGAMLFLGRHYARIGWFGGALRIVEQLLAQDPRWHAVLDSDPGLENVRTDPRFTKALRGAARRAANVQTWPGRVAPWSAQSLARHDVEIAP